MTGRAPLPYEPSDIRARLQGRLHDLLPRLGIDDRLRGKVLLTKNPRRPENTRKGNFAIWLTGDGAGSWKDYGLAGEKTGDVFQLIEYLARLNSWIDSYWWALDFLNLQRGQVRTAEQAKLDRERVEAERKSREMKRQAQDEARSRALFRSWLSLPESIADTPVERYLRDARGIPMERLGSPKFRLGALRYAVRLEHVDQETGEITYWPAMVAAMTAGLAVTGLHRTWLAPDGRGKAPVHMPKKMAGRTAGAAIRLTTGPSGQNPSRAAAKGIVGPLAVGEGIETSLTVAAAMPEWRVWAAGSVSHMGLLEWPACADRVILLRDNDWKPEAREAFDRVVERWRRQARGRRVDVVQSEVGNDFNDWLKGAA